MCQWLPLNELNILRCSVVLELFFGMTGILVAFYSRSNAVLLDGCYSLLCTLTMMANVRISQMVKLPPSAESPYGYPTLEPLMLFFESIILLGLCLALLYFSTGKLLMGGYIPEFDLALAYEIFSTIIGGATATLFFLLHRSKPSPLIYFEFQEWLVDAAVGAAAATAFALAYHLGNCHPITPYIDSLLTILLLFFLIRLPLKTLRKNFKQLLLKDVATQELLESTRNAISELWDTRHIDISMIWLGRWLWINIEITIHNNTLPNKDELQKIRTKAENTISSICRYYRLQLSLSFLEK
ncbi:cation transporter [Endozoicomonas sp. SCSIO W0465]|uniref:cation transporter n=1 Tax=Endozoicomonas sp. SCSIO W0465 TaxID=2918516 RepID=UPI002074E34D|nr:cation transporter [Endozoicomonas sp. SCSIO W0465]USE34434.1 cation transporter [Endozoicomonas sp. SCSIO W0465]